MMIFLDTNIIVRLYGGATNLLSKESLQYINNNKVYISPIVLLELEYLFEIGKIKESSKNIINYLSDKIGLEVDDDNFFDIIEFAIQEKWTRDPFDRIIVSHAKKRDSILISKDRKIRKHYSKTV